MGKSSSTYTFIKASTKKIENSTQELNSYKSGMASRYGESTLSSYNTIGITNNYNLISLNYQLLSYFYTSDGLFQNAIRVPIQDGMSKGFNIEGLDDDEVKELMAWFNDHNLNEKIKDTLCWARLFGGGGLLINTNQDPTTPLNLNAIDTYSKIEFYDVDRWELTKSFDGISNIIRIVNGQEEPNFFYYYGNEIHKSRVVTATGKRAPHYIRQQLQGWGMSEGERIIRSVNMYKKTQEVLFELMDEAKIDIYSIPDFVELIHSGQSEKIFSMIETMNMSKNYLNAVVKDIRAEYEQKSINFGGMGEIKKINMIEFAGEIGLPLLKIYGSSASTGFNTGEIELENYNTMVESEIRPQLKNLLLKILEIGQKIVFGFVRPIDITFDSLRLINDLEISNMLLNKLHIGRELYDTGAFTTQEFVDHAKKEGIITTNVSDKSAMSMYDSI